MSVEFLSHWLKYWLTYLQAKPSGQHVSWPCALSHGFWSESTPPHWP